MSLSQPNPIIMKEIIKEIVDNTNYKKSAILSAIKIRDGYMTYTNAPTRTKIYIHLKEDEAEPVFQHETYTLEEFINFNLGTMFDDIPVLERKIELFKKGESDKFFILVKNNFFSRPSFIQYMISETDDKEHPSIISINEAEMILDFMKKSKERKIEKCKKYWKRFGASKLKFVYLRPIKFD